MTREKTKLHYGWLVILSLLLGLGIQVLLGVNRARTEAADSAAVLRALSGAARAAAAEELEARETRRETSAERVSILPQIRRDAQDALDPSLMILVNRWNPLPEDYDPELTLVAALDNREYELDIRCAQAFWSMMDDCAAAGGKPYICSAFRSQRQQEELYQDKIRRLEKDGTAPEEAPALAAESVAVPGTSEHQLGLAADIIDEEYPYLDEGQEETVTQKWLMENSWHYGFILRYPNGTTPITGIIYEPWHYRYVGTVCAEEIHRTGLTLEEYLQRRVGR